MNNLWLNDRPDHSKMKNNCGKTIHKDRGFWRLHRGDRYDTWRTL